jgi:plastocyanin
MDPKCSEMNRGKQVVQALVMANLKGDLANAFVSLKGTFPKSAAPTKPVVLDQQGCVFVPRVMGARVGQTIEIKSSDAAPHNAHAQTNRQNNFNLMQASPSVVSKFQFKSEEIMLKITCDLHSWMVAYVGVVDHPFSAVTGETGTFTIDKVPAGSQTVQVWHERYGPLTKTVTVAAGKATTVDFAYTGNETAPRGAIEEPTVPGNAAVRIAAR